MYVILSEGMGDCPSHVDYLHAFTFTFVNTRKKTRFLAEKE